MREGFTDGIHRPKVSPSQHLFLGPSSVSLVELDQIIFAISAPCSSANAHRRAAATITIHRARQKRRLPCGETGRAGSLRLQLTLGCMCGCPFSRIQEKSKWGRPDGKAVVAANEHAAHSSDRSADPLRVCWLPRRTRALPMWTRVDSRLSRPEQGLYADP